MQIENILNANKLRTVAGAFATGIAVVSVIDENEEVLGMTINSFLSVSLDPPMILFSAANDSRILDYCTNGSKLSINILSDSQKQISNHFAGIPTGEHTIRMHRDGEFILLPDCIAWYKLSIDNTIEAGDHHLVLCNILDCDREPGVKPVIFYDGYRKIGEQVD